MGFEYVAHCGNLPLMRRFGGYVLPCLAILILAISSRSSTRQVSPHEIPTRTPTAVAAMESTLTVGPPLEHRLIEPQSRNESSKDKPALKETRDSASGVLVAEETASHLSLGGHIVDSGDTLTGIAARYDTSVATTQELNGIFDPDTLLIGQELIVAGGYSGSGALSKAIDESGFEREVIGLSANGHPIESFRKGSGPYQAIVVGAIHGGYEWNTALLAYRLITYFSLYSELIPSNVTLHIIPIANPDGVAAVIGEPGPFSAADVSGETTVGRLNGNGVDLNRNWGCDWRPQAQWRQDSVSGGTRPISEPENRALREYFVKTDPTVVVWLHSAAGLLVPGSCNGIRHEASEKAAALYGFQSGYPVGEFSAYPVTGDAANWLAQHKIASFTVELANHQDLEFDRNLVGLLNLLGEIETLQDE